ncbi:MAG TPA: CGNR zinc finger domain-containing protein [Streptosporangiaceae bacterium]|jgi:predicted RNA-binding Zn ribbon-like protein
MAETIGRAPGELAVVQSLVNTRDIEESTDELADPAGLQAWLERTGLSAEPISPDSPTAADLSDAIRLREALRKVLRSHVTHGPVSSQPGESADAAAELREVSARLPTVLEVGDDGRVRLMPAGAGSQAALAKILLIAAEAATLGTWDRLKVCGADDCQWAFYDRSPTRNGCWCSMQICGSRAKSRAYRRRAMAAKR